MPQPRNALVLGPGEDIRPRVRPLVPYTRCTNLRRLESLRRQQIVADRHWPRLSLSLCLFSPSCPTSFRKLGRPKSAECRDLGMPDRTLVHLDISSFSRSDKV